MTAVIVGYMDTNSTVFCSTCWPEQVEAGARAYEVLKDDRDDADDRGEWRKP